MIMFGMCSIIETTHLVFLDFNERPSGILKVKRLVYLEYLF